MIIGTREAWARIAEHIQDSLAPDAGNSERIAILDLSIGNAEYVVTCHVDGPEQPATNFPNRRGWGFGFVAVSVLAVIGFISIVRWVASAF